MSNALLKTIKTAAIEAVEATKPTAIVLGNVISVEPLKISVEQKLTIEPPFIAIPKSLTDYDLKVQIDGAEKTLKILNALQTNDKVIMLKKQGGQKYIIIDRI